jgi:hypothetical protein
MEKVEQADFWGRSLFQAVTQVNLTALNTLLLLTALCSFLVFSFILFSSPLLKTACRLF